MLKGVLSFVHDKYAYILGFCAVEAIIYCLTGPTGNFTTGFPGLFAIWIFYNRMSKHGP